MVSPSSASWSASGVIVSSREPLRAPAAIVRLRVPSTAYSFAVAVPEKLNGTASGVAGAESTEAVTATVCAPKDSSMVSGATENVSVGRDSSSVIVIASSSAGSWSCGGSARELLARQAPTRLSVSSPSTSASFRMVSVPVAVQFSWLRSRSVFADNWKSAPCSAVPPNTTSRPQFRYTPAAGGFRSVSVTATDPASSATAVEATLRTSLGPDDGSQAAPPTLVSPAGQFSHACASAGRCWLSGHARQLSGFSLASVCKGQSTHVPDSSRLAVPQPQASPGELPSPAAQAAHAVASNARSESAGQGSQRVLETFGTWCAGQSEQAPFSSNATAPEHSGDSTSRVICACAVSPSPSVAPTAIV